jgi:hypothetical protein
MRVLADSPISLLISASNPNTTARALVLLQVNQ